MNFDEFVELRGETFLVAGFVLTFLCLNLIMLAGILRVICPLWLTGYFFWADFGLLAGRRAMTRMDALIDELPYDWLTASGDMSLKALPLSI